MDIKESSNPTHLKCQLQKQTNLLPSIPLVEQKVYKLGLAIFSSKIRIRQHLRLLNGNILQKLETDSWKLVGRSLDQRQRWQQIFSILKQAHIKQLHYQKNPQVLKNIQPIMFHQLQELNLFCANIQNYEAFSFISVPKLQKINLIYNKCSNFKAFNKVHMPSMKIFCIYIQINQPWVVGTPQPNISFSIQDLQRWGFELTELRLEKSKHERIGIQDLSKLAKSKQCLKQVYLCPKRRIRQNKVIGTIKQKQVVKFLVHNQLVNEHHELNIQN